MPHILTARGRCVSLPYELALHAARLHKMEQEASLQQLTAVRAMHYEVWRKQTKALATSTTDALGSRGVHLDMQPPVSCSSNTKFNCTHR